MQLAQFRAGADADGRVGIAVVLNKVVANANGMSFAKDATEAIEATRHPLRSTRGSTPSAGRERRCARSSFVVVPKSSVLLGEPAGVEDAE